MVRDVRRLQIKRPEVSTYSGRFQSGLPHGPGELTISVGGEKLVLEGHFRAGKLVTLDKVEDLKALIEQKKAQVTDGGRLRRSRVSGKTQKRLDKAIRKGWGCINGEYQQCEMRTLFTGLHGYKQLATFYGNVNGFMPNDDRGVLDIVDQNRGVVETRVGPVVDGKLNGKGSVLLQDGSMIEGEFNGGRLVDGQYYHKENGEWKVAKINVADSSSRLSWTEWLSSWFS